MAKREVRRCEGISVPAPPPAGGSLDRTDRGRAQPHGGGRAARAGILAESRGAGNGSR